MVQVPISPELQQSYRETLNIPDAPSFIETSQNILPVAVIAQTSTAGVAPFQKITDGTDTLSVNTDGSINAVANPTTRTVVLNASSSTGDFAVPANKVWKIVYLHVSIRDTSTADVYILLGGTRAMGIHSNATGGAVSAVFPYDIAPTLTAGQEVETRFITADDGDAVFGYIEEDA